MKYRLLYWFFTGILFVSLLSAFWSGALAPPSTAATLPTVNAGGAILPDWNQISFSTMPGMTVGGVFQSPPAITEALGYNPSRTWNAGDTPDAYSKLGDFEGSFNLQELSVGAIANAVGKDMGNLSLVAFEVMQAQTLGSLIEAIPPLGAQRISSISPIFDLLSANTGNYFNPAMSLSSVLQMNPSLGQLRFDTLDLRSYGLGDIPGIEQIPLSSFKDWRNTSIQGVPGLNELKFAQFPNPPNPNGSAVGTVDVAFGVTEGKRNRTISGSQQQGFSVPCLHDCAHVELAGSGVLGRQWISGKYQEVEGGFGLLGAINNGLEPTGRHPFGDAFKVVIWDVDEARGKVDTALFFRFCQRGLVDLGCTPYFVGPIGWLSYHEGSNLFLGALDSPSAPSSSATTPRIASSPLGEAQFWSGSFTQFSEFEGVNLSNLIQSISSVEGNHNSVGAYTCSGGQCGRGLGIVQMMSYRSDVQAVITAKPGGKEFLGKLAQENAQIDTRELLHYFSPQEQESLFKVDAMNLIQSASSEIDPITGANFSGGRLIERVAQKHFAGSSVPIDSHASDVHGRLSVKDYGKEVASYYQSLQLTQ